MKVEVLFFIFLTIEQATKDGYYLHAGAKMIADLQSHARKSCGFATIHNLNIMSNDDRMESFFLSETLKYLFLLFDEGMRVCLKFVIAHPAHNFPCTQIIY